MRGNSVVFHGRGKPPSALANGKAHAATMGFRPAQPATEPWIVDATVRRGRARISDAAAGRRSRWHAGSDRRLVEAVAAALGLFVGVFASDGMINLAGAAKARALCDAFGAGAFDYVGNARVDFPVWENARRVWLAGAGPHLQRSVVARFPEARIVDPSRRQLSDYLRTLRVHQWLKNLLIFVPAATAHRFMPATVLALALAFLSFSLCASSAYIANDLLDLGNDRAHLRKRSRPLASGRMPLGHALAAVAGACGVGSGAHLAAAARLSRVARRLLPSDYGLFARSEAQGDGRRGDTGLSLRHTARRRRGRRCRAAVTVVRRLLGVLFPVPGVSQALHRDHRPRRQGQRRSQGPGLHPARSADARSHGRRHRLCRDHDLRPLYQQSGGRGALSVARVPLGHLSRAVLLDQPRPAVDAPRRDA